MDGYHEIVSLFQAIDLCDRLYFIPSRADRITCTDSTIPVDEKNLVVRALACFRAHFPMPAISIHIEKKIPIQGGFGGGSGNAATTLWALNELSGQPATVETLIALGASIGSDVPFFFSLGTAYCTGRGEILEPFTLPSPLSGYLAKPHYGLSTVLVYKNLQVENLSKRDLLEVRYPSFFNDLETASFAIEPRLHILKEELQRHFATVVMTGSGSAFFCLGGKPPIMEDVTFMPFTTLSRPSLERWY